MKQKLFIYETLRHRNIQKEALGHTKTESRAVLPGWSEVFIGKGKDAYPTLIPSHSVGSNGNVKGDIILIDQDDLKKLDKWEDHYRRIKVATSAGEAWTFVYTKPRDR